MSKNTTDEDSDVILPGAEFRAMLAEIERLETEREILRVEACRWRNAAMDLGHRGWLDR